MSNYVKKIEKLVKEYELNNESIYCKKYVNFYYEFCGNGGEKSVDFFAINNSIIDVNITIESNNLSNIKIEFNDVVIVNLDNIIGEICIIKKLFSNNKNQLKIFYNSDIENDIKIHINLAGNIITDKNYLINCKFFNDKIYTINSNMLSESIDIMTITHNIHYNNNDNSDKYFDSNVNIVNALNNEKFVSNIYSNIYEQIILKNKYGEFNLNIDDVKDACLLSINSDNFCYNIVFISDGKLYYRGYDFNLNLIKNVQLNNLNHIKFCRVKSISSDNFINYFWAQSTNNIWYLIEVNLNGQILTVREYVDCIDLSNYFFDGINYIIQLNDVGIIVEKFDTINLDNKVESVEYKNVDNALIYNSKLYIINGFNIQEVEL